MSSLKQEELMREALSEARKGMTEGEAPIGCVIAIGQGEAVRIVARGHNRVNALQRKNAHAEIVAFENAGSRDGEPAALPLDAQDVTLVSTLEPCVMCLGAAMEAGVSLVIFGMTAPADSGTGRVKPPESPESTAPDIVGGVLADESRALFEEWLEGNRGTEQAKFVEQLLALTASNSLLLLEDRDDQNDLDD
jgi:tRNA(adenine34) deaminase